MTQPSEPSPQPPPKPSSRTPPGPLRRFGPLVLIGVAAVAIFASGLGKHLSLHELAQRRAALAVLTAAHPLASLAAYVAIYVAALSLSLPVALVLTLSGGLLFGPWLGGAAADIGCALGSSVIFLVCRTAIGDALRGRAGSMIERVQKGVKDDAFAYVVALRLTPIAPLWLVNLALGFVDIPLATYFWATLLGAAPASLIYAGLGAGLTRLLASGRRIEAADLATPQVVLPLAGLGLMTLGAVWLRHRRGSKAA